MKKMPSDTIQVVVRAKPLITTSKAVPWLIEENNIYQIDDASTALGECYTFDKVFDVDQKNVDIYETAISPMVHSAIEGINLTIFAYGATSSGKTYTMNGTPDDPGVIPRVIKEIFDEIQLCNTRKFLLRVSYVEIYREIINDLLDKNNKDLKIREDINSFINYNPTEKIIKSCQECLNIMKMGTANRTTGETMVNTFSSRSHSIFRIIIESTPNSDSDQDPVQVSQVNLIDLAGSERVSQTGATGERFKEGAHINKSLTVLGLVIRQLVEKKDYISYRDSKLTRILSNSLGGNAETIVICNINLLSLEDTLSTLLFAQRAKAVKVKPKVTEILNELSLTKRYAKECAQLKTLLDAELEKNKQLEQQSIMSNKEISNLTSRIQNMQESFVKKEPFKKPPRRRHTVCSILSAISEEKESGSLYKNSLFTDEELSDTQNLIDSEFSMQNENSLNAIPENSIGSREETTPVKVLRERLKILYNEYDELREFTRFEKSTRFSIEQDMAQKFTALSNENSDLRSSLECATTQIRALLLEDEKSKQSIIDNEYLIESQKKRYEKREMELLEQISELNSNKAGCYIVNEKIPLHTSQVNSFEYEEMIDTIESLKKQNEKFQEVIESLHSDNANLKYLEEKNQKLQEEKKSLEMLNSQLQNKFSSFQSESLKLNHTICALELQESQLKTRNKSLVSKCLDLELTQDSILSNNSGIVSSLEKQVSELKNKVRVLENELDKVKTELNDSLDKLLEVTEDLDVEEKKCSELQKKLEMEKRLREEAEISNNSGIVSSLSVSELNNKVRVLENELDIVKTERNDSLDKLLEVTEVLDVDEKKCSELQKKLEMERRLREEAEIKLDRIEHSQHAVRRFSSDSLIHQNCKSLDNSVLHMLVSLKTILDPKPMICDTNAESPSIPQEPLCSNLMESPTEINISGNLSTDLSQNACSVDMEFEKLKSFSSCYLEDSSSSAEFMNYFQSVLGENSNSSGKNANSKLDEGKKTYDELLIEVETLKSEIGVMKLKSQSDKAKIDILQKQLDDFNYRNLSDSEKIEKTNENNSNIMVTLESVQTERVNSLLFMEKLKCDNANDQLKYDKLQEINYTTCSKLEEKNREIGILSEKHKNLSNIIGVLNSRVQVQDIQINDQKKLIDKATMELDETRKHKMILEKEIEEFKYKLANVLKVGDHLNSIINSESKDKTLIINEKDKNEPETKLLFVSEQICDIIEELKKENKNYSELIETIKNEKLQSENMLKKELNVLLTQIEYLNETNADIKSKFIARENEYHELSDKLRKLEEKKNSIEELLEKTENEKQNREKLYKNEINELQSRMNILEKINEDLNIQNTAKENQFLELHADLEKKNESNENFKILIKKKKDNCNQLRIEVENNQILIKKLKSDKHELEESLQDTNHQLLSRIDELKRKIEDLMVDVKQKETEIEKIKIIERENQHYDLSAKLKKLEENKNSIEEWLEKTKNEKIQEEKLYRNEINKLQSQINNLQKNNEDLNIQNTVKEKQFLELHADLEKKNESIENFKILIEKENSNCKLLRIEVENNQILIKNLESEKQELQKSLQDTNQQLLSQIDGLNRKIGDLMVDVDEKETVIENIQIIEREKQHHELSAKLKKLEENRNSIQNLLDKTENEKIEGEKNHRNEINSLLSRINILEKNYNDLNIQNSVKEDQLLELRADLEKKIGSNEKLNILIEKEKDYCKLLTIKVENNQALIKKLESEKQELQESLQCTNQQLLSQIDDLNKKIEDLLVDVEKKETEISKLCSEQQKIVSEKDSYSKLIEKFEKEKFEVEEERNTLLKRLHILEKNNCDLKDTINNLQVKQSTESMIDKVHSEIKRLKEIIPKDESRMPSLREVLVNCRGNFNDKTKLEEIRFLVDRVNAMVQERNLLKYQNEVGYESLKQLHEKVKRECEVKKRQNDFLIADLKTVEDERDKLRLDNDACKSEVEQLKNSLKKMQSKQLNYQSKIENLSFENQNFAKKLNDMEKLLLSYENNEQKLHSSINENKMLTFRLCECKKQLINYEMGEEKVQNLQAENKKLTNKIHQLESEIRQLVECNAFSNKENIREIGPSVSENSKQNTERKELETLKYKYEQLKRRHQLCGQENSEIEATIICKTENKWKQQRTEAHDSRRSIDLNTLCSETVVDTCNNCENIRSQLQKAKSEVLQLRKHIESMSTSELEILQVKYEKLKKLCRIRNEEISMLKQSMLDKK